MNIVEKPRILYMAFKHVSTLQPDHFDKISIFTNAVTLSVILTSIKKQTQLKKNSFLIKEIKIINVCLIFFLH